MVKIVKPSFEIMDWTDPLKHLEKIGRVCYKSEDKITDDSAEPFVAELIKKRHLAVIEHISMVYGNQLDDVLGLFGSTSIKTLDDLKDIWNKRATKRNLERYFTQFRDKHHITVKFICNRGFTHELVRHRCFKFPDDRVIRAKYSQESTRYCNYSKNKFGREITVIEPVWYSESLEGEKYKGSTRPRATNISSHWRHSVNTSEDYYFHMLDQGATPQEARAVLPISLKTEIIGTTTLAHWKFIFKLRCDKAAHPEMRRLMIPLEQEFIDRGYING